MRLETLTRIIKHWGAYIGAGAGILTIVAVGVGLFTLQNNVSDLQRITDTQSVLIQDAINAAHEKELQCKDMVHSFNAMKMKYKYCGDK